MNKFSIAIILSIACACVQAEQDEDALRECGNIHHIEFRNLPNANATFSNRNCMLKCSVGNKTLSDDVLNDGFPCPLDSNGVCHNGQCIGSQTNALRECSNIHLIDLHQTHSSGSAYANNQCSLRCVISGSVISDNAINEGFVCPTEPNGICRNGRCVQSNQHSTVHPPSSGHLHNITEVQVNIITAYLDSSFYKLSAIACIEEAHRNDTLHSFRNCQKRCTTNVVAGPTANPQWNFNCYLNGPFHNAEDYLLVTVFERYQNPQYAVGVLRENLQSYYNQFYPVSLHKNTTDMYYQNDFKLYRSDFYRQTGEITMELGILLSGGQ